MKRNYILIFSLLLLFSCKEPEARRPKTNTTSNFYQELISKQKRLVEFENKQISKLLAKDTIADYKTSSTGFWYTYNTSKSLDTITPKTDDIVTIQYDIKDLNDVVIYPIIEKEYKVDKEDLIPALQDGIKLMKSGETITFVIPSHRAFGLSGDGKKIKSNQPIKSTVTLINIKTK